MSTDPAGGERPMARLATLLGCTEGRAYTLTIGLALSVLLAVYVVPAARTELIEAATPPLGVVEHAPAPSTTTAPSTPSPRSDGVLTAPTETSPTTAPTPTTTAPAPRTGSSSPPLTAPDEPPRDPNYQLPPELRPLEAAVANVIREGCSRLSLVNTVLSLTPPEVRDPISQSAVLGLLSEVYVACDGVAYPPTRVVCELDRQLTQAILSTPLGLFVQSFPPVVGHTVDLLTAPTDVVFDALGMPDPVLGPTLMQLLGCEEVER